MKHASHVIIRGQVYLWEEKAPFVASGKSVQGALEYDRDGGKVKCHECGRWFSSLGYHITRSHPDLGGKRSVPYKHKHGLRLTSSLISPATNQKRKKQLWSSKRREAAASRLAKARAAKENWVRQRTIRDSRTELRNESCLCPIQIQTAIAVRSAELGRTARMRDFGRAFVCEACKRFGSWTKACLAAGLDPNSDGRPKMSREILINTLIDFYVLNNRIPCRGDFGGSGRLAAERTYRTYFGTIANAYQAAGLLLRANEEQAA